MSLHSRILLVDAPLLESWALVTATDILKQLFSGGITTTDHVYQLDDNTGRGNNAIARTRRYYQSRCSDPKLSKHTRRVAIDAVARLDSIADLHIYGDIKIVVLDDEETELCNQLVSAKRSENLGLPWPIGYAAASCVAVAAARGMVLASDDDDARTALDCLSPEHPKQSTQDLLRIAVVKQLISKEKANNIHGAMCQMYLWNPQPPYPNI